MKNSKRLHLHALPVIMVVAVGAVGTVIGYNRITTSQSQSTIGQAFKARLITIQPKAHGLVEISSPTTTQSVEPGSLYAASNLGRGMMIDTSLQ